MQNYNLLLDFHANNIDTTADELLIYIKSYLDIQ